MRPVRKPEAALRSLHTGDDHNTYSQPLAAEQRSRQGGPHRRSPRMAAEEKAPEEDRSSLVAAMTDLPAQAWRSVVDSLDECTGLPKYPILRYVSDGAEAPPPLAYIPETPVGFAPVSSSVDDAPPRSYEDAVAMTEFVCEFVDLLSKKGLRVRHCDRARVLRLWRNCRDVSWGDELYALADASVRPDASSENAFALAFGGREFVFETYDAATRKLVVDGLRLLVERAVSAFFTSDEFRVRRARRRSSGNTTR